MPALTAEQVAFFHREGYVHVPDALAAADLDPVQAELEEIVDRNARRLLQEEKIDRDYAELPFAQRLVPLAKADPSAIADINIPGNLGQGIFDFLHNDNLLDLVESLIGPEIYANSCQHIRAKLPATDDYAGHLSHFEWARSTAWHQDLGVLLPEADDTLIPTGKISPVAGTELDFTKATRIGDRIPADSTPFKGYDHNLVLDNQTGELKLAARLKDPTSGRVMEILTTEPGVQFYTGNFLFGQKGKDGKVYEHRGALCLETQHYPDSINHPEFPSVVLRPGKTYRHSTVHKFSAE